MATTYTLTLPTGKKARDAPKTQPAPYTRTCGHWHRSPEAAAACTVSGGRPKTIPPVAVVARDGTRQPTRCLTEGEERQMEEDD